MILNKLQNSMNERIEDLNGAKLQKSDKTPIDQGDSTSFYAHLLKNKRLLAKVNSQKLVKNTQSNVVSNQDINPDAKFETLSKISQNDHSSGDNNLQLYNFSQFENDNQILKKEFSQLFPGLKKINLSSLIDNINSKLKDSTMSESDSTDSQKTISILDLGNILGINTGNSTKKNTFSVEDIPELINNPEPNINNQNLLNDSTQLSDWLSNDDVKNLVNKVFNGENQLKTGSLDSKFKNKLNELFGVNISDELGIQNLKVTNENPLGNVIDINSFTQDFAKQINELEIQSNIKNTSFIKDIKDLDGKLTHYFDIAEKLPTDKKIDTEVYIDPKLINKDLKIDSNKDNLSKINNAPLESKLDKNIKIDTEFIPTIKKINSELINPPQESKINNNIKIDNSFIPSLSKQSNPEIVITPQESKVDSNIRIDNSFIPSLSKQSNPEIVITPQESKVDSNIRIDNSFIPSLSKQSNPEIVITPQESKVDSNIRIDNSFIPSIKKINSEINNAPQESKVDSNIRIDNSFIPSLSKQSNPEIVITPQESKVDSNIRIDNSFIPSIKKINSEINNAPQESKVENLNDNNIQTLTEKIATEVNNISNTKIENKENTSSDLTSKQDIKYNSNQEFKISKNENNSSHSKENNLKNDSGKSELFDGLTKIDELPDLNQQVINLTNKLFESTINQDPSVQSQELPIVNIQELKEGIKLIFNNINQDGNYSAELNLAPKELGKINIIIQMQSESAKIFIKADKSETMDAMQSQIDELISNLNDKGIKIESFELSLNDKSDFTENFEKNQQDQKKQKENLKDKQQFINSFGQEKSSASIS